MTPNEHPGVALKNRCTCLQSPGLARRALLFCLARATLSGWCVCSGVDGHAEHAAAKIAYEAEAPHILGLKRKAMPKYKLPQRNKN